MTAPDVVVVVVAVAAAAAAAGDLVEHGSATASAGSIIVRTTCAAKNPLTKTLLAAYLYLSFKLHRKVKQM